jgi:glycosyltransferase involved in cell wall biosynthesis
MRILFAGVEPFIPDCYSAPSRTILELSRHLALMGHEPVVLSGMSPVKDQQIFRDKSFSFPIYRSSKPLQTISALVTTILPDIVVLAGREMKALVEILAEMDFPVTVWLFDSDQHGFNEYELSSEIQFLASSSFVAEHARTFLGVQALVVPPFISEPGEVRSSPGDSVLFFNPSRRKGVEMVFDIASQRPSLRFTIVETGCMSDKWRQYCYKKASQCGNIDWRKPSFNMYEFYNQARMLLVPSLCEEGFCRIVTEAQRYGIPVLASNRGYLPMNVGDGGTTLDPYEPLQVWLETLDRIWERASEKSEQVSMSREHAFRSELETGKLASQFISIVKAQTKKISYKLTLQQQ